MRLTSCKTVHLTDPGANNIITPRSRNHWTLIYKQCISIEWDASVAKWVERSLRFRKVRLGQVKDWTTRTCYFPGYRSLFKA